MRKEAFLNKYCNAPKNADECHQIVWDLLEEMEYDLNDESLDIDTAIASTLYSIDVLLEVMRTDIPDYMFLKMMARDLEKIER